MKLEKIVSITAVGKRKAYDLSIKDRWKGYLVAGIQTHNSGGDFRASFTIEDAFSAFEDGIKFKKKYPEVVDIAIKMEGQRKSMGQHAAAIVISKDDLREGHRANLRIGKKAGETLVNWGKEDAEHMGLMKLDVLGLNALTVLNETRKLVKINHGVDIDYESLDLNDKRVYEEFSKGNNIGCFQMGSPGMRKYCQELVVEDFDNLVAANALFRPGTLRSGMTTQYCLRKHGQTKWSYPHPFLEKLTKDTYGIIVYQEQVMRFMYDLGGLGWKTADTVRKVISKSKGAEQFLKFKDQFVEGCKKNNTLDPVTAAKLWDELASFGSYSFNKCIHKDTKICVPAGKSFKRMTVESAYKSKVKQCYIFDQKLKKSRKADIKEIVYTGKKRCYELTVKNNRLRKIITTEKHRFLTPEGWKPLIGLSAGDLVMVKTAKTLLVGVDNPATGKTPWNKDKAGTYITKGKGRRLAACHRYHLSEAAKTRTKHGHTGCRHSKETKEILRKKTIDGIKNGRFPRYLSGPHQKLCGAMKEAGIWKGFKNEYAFKNRFSIDIADPVRRIAIEVHGDYWHANPKYYEKRNGAQDGNVGRDEVKADMITKDGWELLVFWESEINSDLGGCLNRIQGAISDASQNPWEFFPIKSLQFCGIHETYDLHIDDEEHNYIANMFVVHNSHSVEYSYIAYWDMWAKVHYPAEFMCASLTWGSESKKEDLVEEAQRLGLKIMLPKVGISKPSEWVAIGSNLYIPFLEIKGIGEKTSDALEKISLDLDDKGFFESSGTKIGAKVRKLLEEVGAFDREKDFSEEDLEQLSSYFSFQISRDPMRKVRKISRLLSNYLSFGSIKDIDWNGTDRNETFFFGRMTEVKFGYRGKFDTEAKRQGISGTADSLGGVYGNFKDDNDFCMLVYNTALYQKKKDQIEHCGGKALLVGANRPLRTTSINCTRVWFEEDLLNCELAGLDVELVRRARFKNLDVLNCSLCELRAECRQPVPSSMGAYNLMIVGEAPGREENAAGVGFVGSSGNLLWVELEKLGLMRRNFHISNIVKCYPSKTKTPSKKHIAVCSNRWLKEEIEQLKPTMILAFGNTALKFFAEQDTGIMEKNGTTEWNDKCETWISWCIHPASVLYHRENEAEFRRGLENFAHKIDNISKHIRRTI